MALSPVAVRDRDLRRRSCRSAVRPAPSVRTAASALTPPRPAALALHLAQVARVPEAVAPRLRPHRQAVRLAAHLHAGDAAVRGVEAVDLVVVAAGQPEVVA